MHMGRGEEELVHRPLPKCTKYELPSFSPTSYPLSRITMTSNAERHDICSAGTLSDFLY